MTPNRRWPLAPPKSLPLDSKWLWPGYRVGCLHPSGPCRTGDKESSSERGSPKASCNGFDASPQRLLKAPTLLQPGDISFETGTGVTELEHEALRKAAKVDRIRVRHKVKCLCSNHSGEALARNRVEKLLGGDRDWHAGVHQALRVHHWTCHSKDLDVISLLIESPEPLSLSAETV